MVILYILDSTTDKVLFDSNGVAEQAKSLFEDMANRTHVFLSYRRWRGIHTHINISINVL